MRRCTIGTLVLWLAFSVNVQSQSEWGLSLQPSLSRGRLPNGTGVYYAGAPNYVGQLKVTEKYVFGLSGGIFMERALKIPNIHLRVDIGYSSTGALQYYDYDYAGSLSKVISIEKRYDYLTFDVTGRYTLQVKRIGFFASLGPHAGHILRSIEYLTNYVAPNNSLKSGYNNLASERQFNFGHRIEIGMKYKKLGIALFYRSYWRTHYNHQNKRVVNTGVNMSYYMLIRK